MAVEVAVGEEVKEGIRVGVFEDVKVAEGEAATVRDARGVIEPVGDGTEEGVVEGGTEVKLLVGLFVQVLETVKVRVGVAVKTGGTAVVEAPVAVCVGGMAVELRVAVEPEVTGVFVEVEAEIEGVLMGVLVEGAGTLRPWGEEGKLKLLEQAGKIVAKAKAINNKTADPYPFFVLLINWPIKFSVNVFI